MLRLIKAPCLGWKENSSALILPALEVLLQFLFATIVIIAPAPVHRVRGHAQLSLFAKNVSFFAQNSSAEDLFLIHQILSVVLQFNYEYALQFSLISNQLGTTD